MSTIAESLSPPARFGLMPRLALAGAITALGDRLFFERPLGISVALFLAALAAGAALANRGCAGRREQLLATAVLGIALLPLVEALGPISLLFGVGGTALFAVMVAGAWPRGTQATIAAALGVLVAGPFQLAPDLAAVWWAAKRQRESVYQDRFLGWIVPLLFCVVFAALFASANPLINDWFAALLPSHGFTAADFGRMALWVVLISFAWAFIATRLRAVPHDRFAAGVEMPTIDLGGPIFGDAAILRSLVLFNLLFAVQTVLDVMYLWGGLALPAGVTYAAYAHRGAYPLMATALLAAAFVLVAMRPGGGGERSPTIRRLVFVWIAQNVLLVISSMLRLELYVAAYSLTLLRMAAFIWMLLVAVGLVLIVVRIAQHRSNEWLIGANLSALTLTLYLCSFVNFAAVIAEFNLAHSSDGPQGRVFDVAYALELGPHAIPALDRHIAARALLPTDPVALRRDGMARAHIQRMRGWRAWTFRDWRLQRYLDKHARVMGGPVNPGHSDTS